MKPSSLLILVIFGSGAFLNLGNAADLYVSTHGTENGPGTATQPFATLEQARDAERKLRAQNPADPVTIWIDGGDYYLDKPLELTEADSGTPTAPTCYRPVEGKTVRLVAARHLGADVFQPITDAQTLARISPEAKDKIVALDLKAVGVTHNTASPDVFVDSGGLPDLYFGGKRMPLARYPKDGFMTMKTVLVNGDSHGTPGVFEYREEDEAHAESWLKALDHGVWLKGYWRVMWENEAIRIKTIDTTAHTITFAKGISSGIGNKYHRPQGDGKEAYWVQNLLEEITQPGEWCIDYTDQKLYFYPPGPLAQTEMELGDADAPAIRLTNASNMIIRGLTIDFSLGNGIEIHGGQNDLIAGCTIRNVDLYAVRVEDGLNHTVQSCDLYNLGVGGVWLSGGDEKSDPRVSNGHKVINNHIYNFAQIQKVYAPAVNCGYTGGGGGGHHVCVGALVAHNLIHDTPHGGILYGSWDNTFEYNEIFRYCLISNDLGAFYSYDNFDRMGNETFRYNLIHGSGDGDGIYFDLDHRDMHIYGNIVFLQSVGNGRGTGFLYKIGTMADPSHNQVLDCHDNIAMACRTGYAFFVPDSAASKIENNVVVNCATPMSWTLMQSGKPSKATESLASGKNKVYDVDPGFVDATHLDFHLKPDAQLLQDLPTFQMPPVDKIGLYVDDYRKTLPTNEEIDRFSEHTSTGGPTYSVEDRK